MTGFYLFSRSRRVGVRPGFLLLVRVLGKLFRRLFLTRLLDLHAAGKLNFFGDNASGQVPKVYLGV